ncbi:hypothetical protein JCM5296_002185 [Sporobolomyces johnsonii]
MTSSDLLDGLPPLRDVNHHINLKDESCKYRPRVYQLPLCIRDQYLAKINMQRSNGQWVRRTGPVDSTIPSHVFLKPNSELRWTLRVFIYFDDIIITTKGSRDDQE